MSKVKQAIGITLFESDNFGGPKIVVWHLPHSKSKQDVLWSD